MNFPWRMYCRFAKNCAAWAQIRGAKRGRRGDFQAHTHSFCETTKGAFDTCPRAFGTFGMLGILQQKQLAKSCRLGSLWFLRLIKMCLSPGVGETYNKIPCLRFGRFAASIRQANCPIYCNTLPSLPKQTPLKVCVCFLLCGVSKP